MITTIVMMLLFIAPTIQYRLELGPFSIALMEPIALAATIFFLNKLARQERLPVTLHPLLYPLFGLVLWFAVIRPWSSNWQYGLSDLRDWIIPLVASVALLSAHKVNWRQWVLLFVLVAFYLALIGIYQHLTDSFRPFVTGESGFKTGFRLASDGSQLVLPSFAAGFFSHPNRFAQYLLIGLTLSMGWLAQHDWTQRVPKILIAVVIGIAMFWSFAKASLALTTIILVLFWLHHWVRDDTLFLLIATGVVLFGAAVGGILYSSLRSVIFETLQWRFDKWMLSLSLIQQQPRILLIGNGLDIFAEKADIAEPHNVLLYITLQSGLLGLGLILAFTWLVLKHGWQTRRAGLMKREPLLAAIWFAIIGFLAHGFTEAPLMEIEMRMIFALLVVSFVGLERELRSELVHAPEA